ncbi:uncharacterized protein LOC121879448 [Homarus americanus]|uniref:uncharacterized protein LOC121879448 n=1 Tax=Homarus americanus TaxID=6706 RepID=UPI001C47B1A2|nr:uncharacterized protein LOC121879448 [Homarus americanus]
MLSALPITLILTLLVRESIQACAPYCSGHKAGDKVRDPTDCTKYYVCINAGGQLIPSTEPEDCTDGDYFEYHRSRCEPISGAPVNFCSPLCNPCVPYCEHAGQLTPDPFDCSIYYVCLDDGHLLQQDCPYDAGYFNFRTGDCVDDDSVCYGYCDICKPHCVANGEKVPDPFDCHNFYQCFPPDAILGTCPHDGVFNRVSHYCESDAECIVDCQT